MTQRFETALIITGDGTGASKAIRLTREQLEQLSKVGKATQGDIGDLSGGVASLVDQASRLQSVLGVIGVAGIAVGYATLTNELMRTAQELTAVSRSLGVSTLALQQWQGAARPLGIEADKMADIFKDVSDKIGDFATTGGGEAKDLFELLNLKIKDFVGLSPDQAFLKIGAALEKSGLTKSQKIFLLESLADDASRLLPLLENNAAALEAFKAKAAADGRLLSDADIATLMQANTELSSLKGAWAAVTNEAGIAGAAMLTAASPTLHSMIQGIAGGLTLLKDNLWTVEAAGIAVAAVFTGKLVSSASVYITAKYQAIAADKAAAASAAITAAEQAAAAQVATQAELRKAQALTATAAAEARRALSARAVAVADLEAAAGTDRYTAALARLNAAAGAASLAQANLAKTKAASTAASVAAAEAATVLGTRQAAATAASASLGLAATAAAGGARLLSGAMALIGGPVGLAITAIAGLLFYLDDLSEWADDSGFSSRLSAEFEHIADSWGSAFAGMPEAANEAAAESIDAFGGLGEPTVWESLKSNADKSFNDIVNGFIELGDAGRILFTYLPQIASAGFQAVNLAGESVGHGIAAAFDYAKAGAQLAFAGILNVAAAVFGKIGDLGGIAIGGLFEMFAGFVGKMAKIGDIPIPGFDKIGAGLKAMEAGWRSSAASANQAGDRIRASVGGLAESYRASAAQSLASAEAHKAAAGGALVAAKAVVDNTQANIGNLESQREMTLEMAAAEHQFAQLDKQHHKNKESATQVATANQGVMKSLDGAHDKAGKLAGKSKGLSDAEKEAKKSAEDLAKAHEKVAELFEKEAQKHEVLTTKLNQGNDAARALELQQQTMHKGVKVLSDAQAAELVQKENINKALEEEVKRREDATQAVKKAQEAADKSAVSMGIARDSVYASDQALRALTLSHEDGYSKAAAESQAQNEALTQSYENQRAIVKELETLNRALTSSDAELAALKTGGAAAYEAEKTRQAAINDLKEKNIDIESALAQKYIASKLAIEEKNKALAAEQAIQENLKNIDWLAKEIEATKQGSAALLAFNAQKDVSNALSKEGLTLESETGKRLADTVKQLAAKNHELERAQFLTESANDAVWLEKEIKATLAGEKALKAFNLQKEIHQQLTRLKIAIGTEEARQVEAAITQQAVLKDRLASIQELRQPISQFFSDLLSDGKNAFANLGDYILNWLKKLIVEFATNKLMLSIGVDATGKGGALGGIGDKITGIFSKIGDKITGAVTSIFGSGGFGGLLGSVAGALGPVALIAGAVSLFKSLTKKDGNLVFGQGMQQGQQLTGQGGHNGQEHYRQTALGLIGATSDSNKIGREKDFVPKFHEALDAMKLLDDMIAKTLPSSVDKFKAALSGLESKGFSIEQIMKQRYSTIIQALPAALQKALTAGKALADMSAEEIIARFKLIEEATNSGLIPALESMKWAAGKSKEEVIALAIGLSNAAGGMDALKSKMEAYYQAAYTEAEREVLGKQQAKTVLDEYNKSLGLSGSQYIDTIAKLRERIEAEDKTTEAGQKNISTLLNMVEAIKTLSGTADEAAKKLQDQWSAFNDAAYTDSEKESLAKKKAQSAVDQFNKTYGLVGDKALKNIIDLRQWIRAQDSHTAAGQKAIQAALGMTNAFVTLGGTAQQIKEKIAALRDSIKTLVGDLYGKTSAANTDSSTSNQAAAQSALDAAEAALESLRSRYDDEKQRIDDLNNAAQEAYREEIARYEQLKQLVVDLREYIAGFKRSNELLTPLQKLQEVQTQYSSTLALAKTGDADAVKNIQGLADELKQSYLDVYASSKPSQDKIAQILADLTGLAGVLDGLGGAAPNQPGTIGSTSLASLEQQIAAQQSTISSLQAAANSANSNATAATAAQDRVALAQELAGKIGQLGLATDKSAWDILKQNGVNINNLAADFGINVKQLDNTFVKKVAELSGLLNVNSLQLLGKIGVSATDLATAYGINADKLDKTMIGKIGGLADQLNVNSFDLLKKLGVTSQELASAYGLNTDKLNQGFLTKLDSLADVLHVDSVTLAQKFGVNIDALGNLMANKLAALPNLPDNIKSGLAPHLQAIRDAADPATLKRELQSLQSYVNTLPPGIKDQLNAQLQGILGYTGDTKTNTGDTKSETTALRGIGTNINSLTTYTRDQLTGTYLAGVWNTSESTRGLTESYLKPYLEYTRKNTKALNDNAASIGKSAIPSFRVGSDGLRGDQLIQAHDGEIIFSPNQSGSVREQIIYMNDFMPRALSSIAVSLASNAASFELLAANAASFDMRYESLDKQHQVIHFNPVLMQVPHIESSPEFLEELKRLRESNERLLESNERLEKQVAELRKDRSQDAQVDHEQRSVMINQNQESLNNQNQARRDAWRSDRVKQVKTA